MSSFFFEHLLRATRLVYAQFLPLLSIFDTTSGQTDRQTHRPYRRVPDRKAPTGLVVFSSGRTPGGRPAGMASRLAAFGLLLGRTTSGPRSKLLLFLLFLPLSISTSLSMKAPPHYDLIRPSSALQAARQRVRPPDIVGAACKYPDQSCPT